MLPPQRKSRSQCRKQRAHQRIKYVRAVSCPHCQNYKLPHAACPVCGYVRPGLTIKLRKLEGGEE